tara:strand:+ start:59073 stop:59966 length:894 start_codon:yes stop_codon:yes gene_type:complete
MKLVFGSILLIICNASCSQVEQDALQEKTPVASDRKGYWLNGGAEISSYELTQARYGELHSGRAVLVFVTEPFSLEKGTKSESPTKTDVSILKLNFTKKFNTGIYPYSMMTSTFYPYKNGEHSLKISSSSQEWCGHTYMELTNKKKFEVKLLSYFEDQSFENLVVEKTILEDDIWTMIRLQPQNLPEGSLKIIPSFFYLRLMHGEFQAYECETSSKKMNDSTSVYSIQYPSLDRSLSIIYETSFPHKIISWSESYESGWGENKKRLTTEAKLINSIRVEYWKKHSNIDNHLRSELGL